MGEDDIYEVKALCYKNENTWQMLRIGKNEHPVAMQLFGHDLATMVEAAKIIDKYCVFSLEDPLSEDDLEGWIEITSQLKEKVQLVGDDLFVTNMEIFDNYSKKTIANAICS